MSNSPILIFLLVTALALSVVSLPLQAEDRRLPQTQPTVVVGATEEILREVSELRGLAVLRPVQAGLQSRFDIERSLIRDLDEKTTPEEFDAETKTLSLLGLIPKDFALRDFLLRLLTEQVAGYYRPKTKMLYLADWLALDEQRTVMVHELMHALQDQHFNLERFENPLRGQSDKDLAIHALVEGEATAVMMDYLLKPHQLTITRLPVPLTQLFEQMQLSGNGGGEVLQTAPAVVRESLLFPYTYGTQFVQYLLTHASWDRVSEAYKAPPDSTEQVLHPERFLTRDAPVEIKLSPLEPILGKEWKKRLFDVSGEFGYFLILSQYLDREPAQAAAAGWDGDQLVLYEDAQKRRLLLAHLSSWDSAAEAEEFTRAYIRRLARRYTRFDDKTGKRELARVWKTSEGVVYLEKRSKEVLVIETAGSLARATLKNAARVLWKRSP